MECRPPFFWCAGHSTTARKGSDNREAKAGREVTRRCKSSGDLGDRNPELNGNRYTVRWVGRKP